MSVTTKSFLLKLRETNLLCIYRSWSTPAAPALLRVAPGRPKRPGRWLQRPREPFRKACTVRPLHQCQTVAMEAVAAAEVAAAIAVAAALGLESRCWSCRTCLRFLRGQKFAPHPTPHNIPFNTPPPLLTPLHFSLPEQTPDAKLEINIFLKTLLPSCCC